MDYSKLIDKQYIAQEKRKDIETVKDILTTYNGKNEIINISFVVEHEVMGQKVTHTVSKATIDLARANNRFLYPKITNIINAIKEQGLLIDNESYTILKSNEIIGVKYEIDDYKLTIRQNLTNKEIYYLYCENVNNGEHAEMVETKENICNFLKENGFYFQWVKIDYIGELWNETLKGNC